MSGQKSSEQNLDLLEQVLKEAKRRGEISPPLNKEQQEVLWRKARHYMGRRDFLRLLALGGSAAVLATTVPATATAKSTFGPFPALPPPRTEKTPWVKDLSPLHSVAPPFNFQIRYENLKYEDINVPTRLFYLRGLSAAPIIDPTTWRLRVEGPGVERVVELTFDDLLRLPSVSQNAIMDCSGNSRSFFRDIMKKPGEGIQWRFGSNSQAKWEGVPLRAILDRAGVKKTAVAVNSIALDPPAFNRPISIEEALRPDNIIAYGMNDEWLPFDHGWPARLVVPRWTAVNAVKWIGRIYVSTEPIWVELNTVRYILEGPDFKPVGPAKGIPLTTTVMKSTLALSWVYPDHPEPHTLKAGPNRIWGYAWSPFAKMAKVEYSIVSLEKVEDWVKVDPKTVTWSPAKITSPQKSEIEWVRFEFNWDAKPGLYGILSRATDAKGDSQPLETPTWNKFGYRWNRPVAHPVKVV